MLLYAQGGTVKFLSQGSLHKVALTQISAEERPTATGWSCNPKLRHQNKTITTTEENS